MTIARIALAALCAAGLVGAAAAEEAAGTYKRPNGDPVRVSVSSGKLYCQITGGSQAGFEMCHGMAKTGASTWRGSAMKHPGMPGFMTFNGTVTVAPASLTIKGCAVGQSMCDSETWARQK